MRGGFPYSTNSSVNFFWKCPPKHTRSNVLQAIWVSLLGQVEKLKTIKTLQRYRGKLTRKTMLEGHVFEDMTPLGHNVPTEGAWPFKYGM